jgi:hypothetical protein
MIWQSLQMLATSRGGNRYSEQSLADDDPDDDGSRDTAVDTTPWEKPRGTVGSLTRQKSTVGSIIADTAEKLKREEQKKKERKKKKQEEVRRRVARRSVPLSFSTALAHSSLAIC